jgi:hypothetical protein
LFASDGFSIDRLLRRADACGLYPGIYWLYTLHSSSVVAAVMVRLEVVEYWQGFFQSLATYSHTKNTFFDTRMIKQRTRFKKGTCYLFDFQLLFCNALKIGAAG